MNGLTVIGGIIVIGFLSVLSCILNGYALSVLWGWFVVPTFNAPALGIVPAIGIAMVVAYLTYQTHDCKKKDGDDGFGVKMAKATIVAFVKPVFALLFGWIVHLFM